MLRPCRFAVRFPVLAPCLLVLVCFLNLPTSAQIPEGVQAAFSARQITTTTAYETAPNTAVMIFHVFADEKPVQLDRSARVDLTNIGNHLGVFLIVPSHENAVFTNVVPGTYDVAVTAVGYLTTHQELNILNPVTQNVDLVLQRDPSAVVLDEATGVMPPKGKKEANRAVALLKSDKLESAQKHLENAYKLSPTNADLNFLFGYLYFKKNDYAQAVTYLGTAASLGPHSAHTLTLLGRVNLLREDYPAARSALERSVLVDGEDWLSHNLLAYVYLHEKEYRKARDEAQLAVAKSVRFGKNASGSAELALGQAMIALGQSKEGIQTLEAFLKKYPGNPAAPQVRTSVATLKQNMSDASGDSVASELKTLNANSVGAVPEQTLSMQTWRPPDIDDAKPTTVPGIVCSNTDVLAEAGKRVEELVQDLTRFAADEDLFHQALDSAGLSSKAETRKYNYVAALSRDHGRVLVEEYRVDRIPQPGSPDGISSSGFAVLALVFHPDMQGDFDFDCEGKGDWRGQPSWLVHFRQRADRPNRMHSFSLPNNDFVRIDLKGRAWISADTFQILRIEADIVSPMHEIQLLSEHQAVEYGPIPFAKKNTSLWLPKTAEIYFDLRKRHFYQRHTFDHYGLFDVDTQQKDKLPSSTAINDGSSPEKVSN